MNLGLVQLLRGDDVAAETTLGTVLRDASRSHRLVYGGAAALGLAVIRGRAGDVEGWTSHRRTAEELLGGTGFDEPDLRVLARLAEEEPRRGR
ncbi:MAG: hypothetical protein KC621_28225 [Myxococcales bacterium]|nr:hypothetical protein [Myxococcales bacterium]